MKIEIYVTPFVIKVPDGSPDDVNEWIEDQLENEPGGEVCNKLMLSIGWNQAKKARKRVRTDKQSE